jgi:NDP-sugar pyrophosphorylase family protein
MRAVILAGGKGTRLRPYTTLIPKPLVPIGGKYSILEIIIKQLANSGFTHITLAVNHLSQLIQAYFGSGERLNVKIDYSLEEGELSTIGPLTLIKDLPENFLVMNGDILCDLNYQNFYNQHISSGASISVSTFKREVKVDFGVLRYGSDNLLTEFQEKPKYDFDVSMGIYCINRHVITSLAQGEKYGFDNLMWDSLKENRPVNIQPFNGYWLDIGRPEDYEYADENFSELSKKLGIA